MTDIDREVTEEIFEECWHTTKYNCITDMFECTKCHKMFTRENKSIPYSTSWEAMGRLIERMEKDGYDWRIDCISGRMPEDKREVIFSKGVKHYAATDKELPMAVAMAALKTKRGER